MMEAYAFKTEAQAYAFVAGIQLAGNPDIEAVNICRRADRFYVIILNDIDGSYVGGQKGVLISSIQVPRLPSISWDDIKEDLYYEYEEAEQESDAAETSASE